MSAVGEERLKAAVIGCGDVANRRYLPYLSGENPFIGLVACADLDAARARATALRFGLEARDPDAVLGDETVDLILDLAPPAAHFELNRRALEAGKHVYTEKPLATTFAEGQRLVELAGSAGRRIASAPDTILGPTLQLARRLIDGGRAGTPFMASMSFVTSDRHWHENPEFFYRAGGGPILDEGPYFLSALVGLLGPIERVSSFAATYQAELEVGTGPRRGERFQAEVPTSYAGAVQFRSGVLASLLMSFDVRGTTMPPLEIYGSEGTLRLRFPGYYNGSVRFGREHDAITEEITPGWQTEIDEARGIGVEEFARAILFGTETRLDGRFALHILEAMEGIVRSAETGEAYILSTTVTRPQPYDPLDNPRNRLLGTSSP